MPLAQVKGLDSSIYGKDGLVTGCSWLRAADAKCHFFVFTLTHLLNFLEMLFNIGGRTNATLEKKKSKPFCMSYT